MNDTTVPDTTGPEGTRPCGRCEVLPEALPERGVLYLAPPINPTGADIRSYLSTMGLDYTEAFPNIFAVPFERGQLNGMCSGYLCNLSAMEQADTKCMVLAEGEEPDVYAFTKMQPLTVLVARMQGEWLLEVLAEERLAAHFHPIVHTGDPTRVFAHECLIRGKSPEGNTFPPAEMFRIARAADLLFNLDRACRVTVLRDAVKHQVAGNIFINFQPAAIYNPVYCLQTTIKEATALGIDPDRVVFEVVESDEVKDTDHLLDILRYYREHGFRVALDDLGAGYSSLTLLAKLKPDFMKMDMELIRGVDSDSYKANITRNLLEMARSVGVATIAEGVETVGEWRWLKEHGADYIQGFLFARPGAPPERPVVPEVP